MATKTRRAAPEPAGKAGWGWREQAWSPVWFYNHIPVLSVVFCAIPKNGCKTLKRVFLRHAGDTIGLDEFRPGMHLEVAERWSLSRVPKADREPILASARTVVFLRDPLLRIASAFADKVVRVERADLNRAMFEEVWSAEGLPGPVDFDRGISFEQFVSHLHRTACDAMDEHWKPQACFVEGRRFGFVGDVSRMSAEVVRLQRWLGIDVGTPERAAQVAKAPAGVPGEHAGVPSGSLRAAGILPGAASLYTPRLETLVRERYAEDRALVESLLGQAAPARSGEERAA